MGALLSRDFKCFEHDAMGLEITASTFEERASLKRTIAQR